MIDSYCSSVYTTPFATVTKMIEAMSIDLTCYYVMRSLYSSDSQNINEWIEKYNEVKEMLKDIKNGKLQLIDDSGNDLSRSTDRVRSNTSDYVPEANIDSIELWDRSGSRLDDIADDREDDA